MSSIFNIPVDYYSENNIRYVFVDGNTCKKIEQCYKTLQQQLSIPDYFGYNLDALEEVLGDLDWIDEQKIKLILLSSHQLLSDDKEKKNAFLDILNSCENEKIEIIYLSEP
ncbi:MAG TPA: barstar family protein [Hanamia sp.]|jgi:RNAse (barnase) inhibitor barstar|nr:barstar family protein [Hanamia sp.]